MSKLMELCPACDYCHMNNVRLIIPALQAISAWGENGEVIAQEGDQRWFKTTMSNGQESISTIHKSKIKLV